MTAGALDASPPGAEVVLPPHGFVYLQAVLANDLDVVNAARVSFGKESTWEQASHLDPFVTEQPDPMAAPGLGVKMLAKLGEADEALVRWLLKHRHGTPFEHTFFKFHIRAPIFVFREWHRHRIGVSINEESARYTPLAADFYVPDRDAWRRQVGKPGAYRFEPLDDEMYEDLQGLMEDSYTRAYQDYETLMHSGVAKEIARAVLPVGIYSQMIWSCNARSLMAFLSLRNSPTAQREIRLYAAALEDVLAVAMPVSHDAFVMNNRVAP